MTHIAPPHGWLVRVWGDEAVAFDIASGDTHYLPPLTRILLEACRADSGNDPTTLGACAAATLGVEPTPQFLAAVHESLASLQRIGLLQAPSPCNEAAATVAR